MGPHEAMISSQGTEFPRVICLMQFHTGNVVLAVKALIVNGAWPHSRPRRPVAWWAGLRMCVCLRRGASDRPIRRPYQTGSRCDGTLRAGDLWTKRDLRAVLDADGGIERYRAWESLGTGGRIGVAVTCSACGWPIQ